MVNKTVKKESLGALAEKIAHCATQADEHTITAALLIREARKRVEAGEAGEITWYNWASSNIRLSPSRLRELNRIAEAEDPQKELEHIRYKNRERATRHREKKKSAPLRNGGAVSRGSVELEENRKRLIEWALSAPLDLVERVFVYAQDLNAIPANTESDDSAEQLGG